MVWNFEGWFRKREREREKERCLPPRPWEVIGSEDMWIGF